MKIQGLASGFLLSLLSLPAFGLEPYLVKDINPVPEPAGSAPSGFVTLGSVALFEANDGTGGKDLWRSDGTEAGTWQVAQLCHPSCSAGPEPFAQTSRHYFFRLFDESSGGWNVWATDGTPAGTFQLTDPAVSVLYTPTASIGDALFFNVAVYDGDGYLYELWRSDGTPAGTWRVTDQSPNSIVELNGSIYFIGEDGGLWKTDGTPAGTVRVASFPGDRSAAELFVVGSRLVVKVFAYTAFMEELWSSDGTAEGMQPLAGARWFPYFSVQGGRLYFVAEDDEDGQELWVTDGTPRNTRALTHLRRKDAFYSTQGYSLELPRVAAGNRFVFLANDGTHDIEPWVTDGTVKGTHLLKDLCKGSCEDLTQIWDRTLPGLVFMTVFRGNRGRELWVTDGTEVGTHPVRDICPGICEGLPHAPFLLKGRLFFAAIDGVHGDEIWTTDGTAAGTTRISDFAPEEPWYEFAGTVVGEQFLFDASGPEGEELWRTDGTIQGTRLVRDIATADVGGSHPGQLMASGDEAFFFTHSNETDGTSRFALWKSDGTDAGTVQVRAFDDQETNGPPYEGTVSAQAAGQLFFFLQSPWPWTLPMPWRTDGTEAGTYPLLDGPVRVDWKNPEMGAAGNAVFFAVEDMEHGVELWTSDGVPSDRAGTRLVRDIEPGIAGSNPMGLTGFQGKLYFSASTEPLGRELWVSDGTEAGTDLVKAIRPGAGSNPSHLTVHAGRLWFFADDGEHGRELWSSDGTRAGTAFAVDVEPGADSFEPALLVSMGDRLLITGRSPSQGSGIWVTDGTASGTRKISGREMSGYAVFQGRVWFASDGFLWITDGTEAGTVPALGRDGQPLPAPDRFSVLDGHLLFTVNFALWESDGTPAGTFPLATAPDFYVGSEMVRAGSRVFFGGFSPDTGNELWAVEEGHP